MECPTFRQRSDPQGFELVPEEACTSHEDGDTLAGLRLDSILGPPYKGSSL